MTCKDDAASVDGAADRGTLAPVNVFLVFCQVLSIMEAFGMKSALEGKASMRRKWTEEEDALLKAAVNRHDGKNWKVIADEVPGRNHVQCLQRWKKVLKPGLVKGHWTAEEDELLKKVVSEGYKNWGDVAAKIEGRTAKQCRERWSCNLDPNIVRGKWSAEEDDMISYLQSIMGNKWSKIAKKLPGRTENAIKTRAKSLARAKQKAWTPQEDRIIYEAKVSAPTPNTRASAWAKIAERLPGRSKNAVKKRWKELKASGYNGQHPGGDVKASQQIAFQEEKMNVDRGYMTNASTAAGRTPMGGFTGAMNDVSEVASSVSSSFNSNNSPFPLQTVPQNAHQQVQMPDYMKQELYNQSANQGASLGLSPGMGTTPGQSQTRAQAPTQQPPPHPVFQQQMYKTETPPYQQNYFNQHSLGPIPPSPNFMNLGNNSPLNASLANPSPFAPSPFATSHMATSVGSQLSPAFPSSFASQVSMSPQSYLMSGLPNSQVSAAAQGQFLRTHAAGAHSQNFYGATPPVIQHTPDDHRQPQKKSLHFYGATPPVIQHSADDDVEMTDG